MTGAVTERLRLLKAIALQIADYRVGELAVPDAEHVDRWVSQFAPDAQVPMLRELRHVFERTYVSRSSIEEYFAAQITNKDITGSDPRAFWKAARFLDIQEHGHSQEELLAVFSDILKAKYGLTVAECGSATGTFVYLDDVIFSGNRAGNDLTTWTTGSAPQEATILVLVVAAHTGVWKLKERLSEQATLAGKKLTYRWFQLAMLENRAKYRANADVLWPTELPNDADLRAYQLLDSKSTFQPRTKSNGSSSPVFSSEAGRQLLERELLMAGVRIRGFCKQPKLGLRPLGFGGFFPGFGSTIATFRNCPNNAPLALWWGDTSYPTSHPFSKWHPLLSRKTYGDASPFGDEEF